MEVLGSIFEFIKTVAIIIVIAFFVRFFLIQPFVVDGSSMEPNFHNNQYLMVDKLTYRLSGGPRRGDVIVFHPPNQPTVNYIKRVIGLPGEEVNIANGQVKVNGAVLDESYLPNDRTLYNNETAEHTIKLGSDEYFVLGDNRDHSSDSREWGTLPKANIIGRAWVIVFPKFEIVHHQKYALHSTTSALTVGQFLPLV